MEDAYLKTVDKVMEELETSDKGINSKNISNIQKKYGKNVLIEKDKKTKLQIFLAQFKNIMVLLLLVVGVLSLIYAIVNRADFLEPIVILSTTFVNCFMGFLQESKAEDAIAYEDRFVSEGHLIALSKHPRKITSSDAVHIYKQSEEDKNNRIFLFVRKNKDDNEAKEFYFLGEIFAEGNPRQIYMEKTKDNAFEIDYRLDVPVRSDIYDYIVSD